jgi:hypothetical protein
VEAWVNTTAAAIYTTDAANHAGNIWCQSQSGSNYFVFTLSSDNTTLTPKLLTGAGTFTGPALQADTWNHVAVVRKSGVITIYTNGVPGNPVANTTDFNNTVMVPTIGQYSHNSSQLMFSGLLDSVRYTKAARYNGAFNPSIASTSDS